MEPRSTGVADVGLSWLVGMRWGAFVSAIAAILVTNVGLHVPLRLGPLLALVSFTAVTNVALEVRTWSDRAPSTALPGALLLADTLTLTALLYFSGGPSNPFSALYVVYVTLAAVILGARWTWSIVAVACVCYGLLFVDSVVVPEMGGHGGHHGHGDHGGGMAGHLYGMYVAFAVSAVLIAYFVTRVSSALRRREEELARVRERAARSERLASLTTLAAGAAHELGTPLATIAVVAKELERALEARGDLSELADDARLVREELARCRTILDRMAARAGESIGEAPVACDAAEIAARVRAELGPALSARVVLETRSAPIHAPPHAIAQLLENLVRNALDASTEPVTLRTSSDATAARIVVEDRGTGMDPETLARATEPFFTTKAHGKGMGLGLFLSSTLVERLSGTLTFDSAVGRGTTVTVVLPRRTDGP